MTQRNILPLLAAQMLTMALPPVSAQATVSRDELPEDHARRLKHAAQQERDRKHFAERFAELARQNEAAAKPFRDVRAAHKAALAAKIAARQAAKADRKAAGWKSTT